MGKIITAMISQPISNLKVLFFVFVIAFCFSCENKEEYHSFHEIKSIEWSKDNVLVFEIDSSMIDAGVPYDITLDLVYNSNYPYRNIWFYIQNNLESDSLLITEALQYFVCDEYGKWYGSGFGSLYQLPLAYKNTVVFKEKRNYDFKIQQGMRDEPLQGIDKVGLRIEKSK